MKALITGASSGMGADMARVLVEEGYEVILVARRKTRLEKLAKELGDKATIIVKDISSTYNCMELYNEVKKEDIDLARRQLAMLKQQQKESPQYQLNRLMDKTFYGEHPYAKEGIPDDAVLAKVSVQDMRDYLKQFMAKNTLSIGIAGDMDRAESEAFLTQAFAGLNDASKGVDLPEFKPDWNAPKVAEVSDISAQSLIMLKSLGVPRLDDDFYPLLLADYVFGGAGLSSRLSLAVRENEGLTYGIYSFLTSDDTGDFWQIYFSTTPDNTARIFDLLNQEYEKFYREGLSQHELDVAKSSLLSSFNLTAFAHLLFS